MHDVCGKCQGFIIDGRCDCGIWYNPGQEPAFLKTIERAVLAYDHLCEQMGKDDPLCGDHYSGNCFVFFKGNAQDVARVKEFIKGLKNDH